MIHGCDQAMNNHEINISIKPGLSLEIKKDWFTNVVIETLKALDLPEKVELGVVITDNETVRQLNRDYRDLDEYTDILAFYMPDLPVEQKDAPFIAPPDNVKHLGEVIISYPQAAKQATEQGHQISDELTILIIHGILHLLGYDHELTEENLIMQAKADEVRNRIGSM